MFNNIKILSMSVCAALALQGCHGGDDDDFVATVDAPKQVLDVGPRVYQRLRVANPAITEQPAAAIEAGRAAAVNGLYVLASSIAGTSPDVGKEPCQVRLHSMSFDTVGGAGEATNSTGVVMVPYGESAACSGPRPVVLYAHGTNVDRNYDLAKIISDPGNEANSEGAIMLALYASQGYVVIAPNYAGYAGSALDYHPYADEVQQSTEMIDALNHVRTHADNIGADLSSKLFVTGLSQGGYVAMATHKALQAKGEIVTASLPASGPYGISGLLDRVMSGYVNFGATSFAPLYVNALERSNDIYEDPSEVYAVAGAENIFPNPGAEDEGFPVNALFAQDSLPALPTIASPTFIASDSFPNALFPQSAFALGYAGPGGPFDTNHVLSSTFRTQYLNAMGGATVSNAGFKVRELAKKGNLQNWTPTSRVVMCGAGDDPVVYHDLNSDVMASYWDSVNVPASLVTNLDLTETPNAAPTSVLAGQFAAVQARWQAERQAGNISVAALHSTTGVYCAGAGLALFNSL